MLPLTDLSSKNTVAKQRGIMKFSTTLMRASLSSPTSFLKAAILLILCAIPSAASSEEWTLEAVLARITEANGGEEAMEAVRTAKVRGSVSNAGAEVEFLIIKKRPNKVRLRISRLGRFVEMAYDGSDGWMRVQDETGTRITDLDEHGWRALADEADFDGPLIGPPREGVERALLGIERIDRTDYFLIEVKRPRTRTVHYIDSRTFREMKADTYETKDGEEVFVATTHYFEYRKFGPLWVSMRSERVIAGGGTELVLVDEVILNGGILDLIFRRPAS